MSTTHGLNLTAKFTHEIAGRGLTIGLTAQEIKQGQQARIRALFERATSVIMPMKKIKFLFKRYLEYEQQHGTPATVDAVKQAARDYLQRLGI